MAGVDLSKIAVREAPRPKPKRFYKTATVGPSGHGGPPYRVLLDGKPVLTPAKKTLETDNRALAENIAIEWDAQVSHIDPETMPLTRLLSTLIDRVGPDRAAIIAELLKFVDADLLCYRAAHPADLVHRQTMVWQPVLDWVDAMCGAAHVTVTGILPREQPPEVHRAMRAAIESLTAPALTAFQAAAGLTSSLVLSLALVRGRLSAEEVFAAAVLDETYQMERWGDDAEAAARRAHISNDLKGIGRFIALTKGAST
ncbi:MAG: ATP12 family protein [Rhodospirillaceae bacterium]|nr:ATP12 family protein [Rhodospirillaceae bacterium]